MVVTIDEENKKMHTDELSVCVIGHVDAGKSSLCGRLFLETKEIDERKIDKIKKNAQAMNASSFYLAHVTDTNKDEQKRGITINAKTKQFTTPGKKRKITLVDSPGHRDFINNMISGASQCNAAILVVPAVRTEFVAGIDKNGQTLEHMLLVTALGVNKMIVFVNKMDHDSVKWNEKMFKEIEREISALYTRVGGKKDNLTIVPGSGFAGHNVSESYSDCSWYKGPTLLEAIDNFPEVSHDLSVPSRASVSGALKVAGVGQIYTAKLYSGVLKIGDKVDAVPSKSCSAVIKTIEKFHKPAEVAYPGDNIGLALKSITPANSTLKKGDLLGQSGSGLQAVFRFKGMVAILGEVKTLKVGFKPVITSHTAKVASTLVLIESIKSKGKEVLGERDTIQKGDRVLVHFQPEEGKLAIECDTKFGMLTRMVIRNSNKTIGVGMCKAILNDKYEKDFRVVKKNKDGEPKKKKGK